MFKPVEMIFSSDLEGYLTPIKFRIDTEDGLIVVKVTNARLDLENQLPGSPIMDYKVNLVTNGIMKPGKIRFDGRRHIWSVELKNR